MIHQLKIRHEYFDKIINGLKTFEVRKNDRDFQAGDYIGLNEIDDNKAPWEKCETGNFVLCKVLDVFKDPEYVKEGYAILSIRPCAIRETYSSDTPYDGRTGEKEGGLEF